MTIEVKYGFFAFHHVCNGDRFWVKASDINGFFTMKHQIGTQINICGSESEIVKESEDEIFEALKQLELITIDTEVYIRNQVWEVNK